MEVQRMAAPAVVHTKPGAKFVEDIAQRYGLILTEAEIDSLIGSEASVIADYCLNKLQTVSGHRQRPYLN